LCAPCNAITGYSLLFKSGAFDAHFNAILGTRGESAQSLVLRHQQHYG